MSDTSIAYRQQYSDMFLRVAQQKKARIWPRLMGSTASRMAFESEALPAAVGGGERIRGKFAYFDHIGVTEVQDYPGRHADTPLVNNVVTRRRATTRTFVWADLVEPADVIRMGKDPTGAYATESMSAVGRRLDDHCIGLDVGGTLIGGLLGRAFEVDENETATNADLPAAQKIVSASKGLLVSKLITAKRLLWQAEAIEEGEQLFVITNAQGLADLLNQTQPTSSDFNTVKALYNGEIDRFMGFDFIRSERLPIPTGTERANVACTGRALGKWIGEDPFVRIAERADKNFNTQVYARGDVGTTRVEDELVVQINCTQDGVLS